MFTLPHRRDRRRSAGAFAAERLEPRRLLAAGDLDPTFGTGGKVLTDFATSADDEATAIAVQADGKYVVAGQVTSGINMPDSAFGLARYNPDGRLDPTFGDSGKVVLGFGRHDEAESVAIAPDGKIVVAGVTGGRGLNYLLARLNPNGSLDPTFDGDGWRVVAFEGRNAFDPRIAVQADGKVLLAGTPSGAPGGLVVRLNTDGSFDPTFDGDGILNSPASMTSVYGVTLDGDRPVLAGTFASKFAVARLTPTGEPDTSFDGDGVAVSNAGYSASAVSVMADGRIVAVGTGSVRITFMTSKSVVAVARFNADGSPDPTFAAGSFISTLDRSGTAVLPGADGSVIVGCQDGYFWGTPVIFRLTPSGALDSSFGGGSLKVASQSVSRGPALAPGPQGSVVVATAGGSFNETDFLVARYTASGAPDVTFNTTGSVKTDFVAMSSNIPAGMAVLPDGRFAVGGTDSHGSDDGLPLLARYLPDGSPDPSFGSGGTVVGTAGMDGRISAFAAQPDGKLLAAGIWTNLTDVTKTLAAVMRYDADGTPDATFGDGGRVRFDFSTGQKSKIAAMLVQPDGKILVAGDDSGQFALARLLPSGVLDASFGSGGTVITRIHDSTGSGHVTSIALGSDGTIVAAGPSSGFSAPTHTFAVARYDAAGRLDPSFATRGWKEYEVIGLGYTQDPVKAAIAADGRILIGTTLRKTSADKDFLLLSITPWGDAEFGSSPDDGRAVLIDFAGGDDVLGDLLVLPDAIVAVGTVGTGDGANFGVARYSLAGDLDPSFGTSGKVTTDFAGMSDAAVAAALTPDGRLLVAGPAVVPLRAPDLGVARYLMSGGAPVPRVVGAQVFYRGAAPAFAAATDKQPLLPGELPGFRNVTSYARGINGITLDVANPRGVELTADDFAFASMSGDAGTWTDGPHPASVTTQRGAGAGGTDRVTLTWNDFNPRSTAPDQAVANGWLEVTVQPDRLGLAAPYVLRFGNLIGETGDGPAANIARNGLAVGAADVLATRAAQRSPGGASSRFDFNRDGRVNVLDLTVARANVGTRLATPAESSATIASAPIPPARKRRSAYLPPIV